MELHSADYLIYGSGDVSVSLMVGHRTDSSPPTTSLSRVIYECLCSVTDSKAPKSLPCSIAVEGDVDRLEAGDGALGGRVGGLGPLVTLVAGVGQTGVAQPQVEAPVFEAKCFKPGQN